MHKFVFIVTVTRVGPKINSFIYALSLVKPPEDPVSAPWFQRVEVFLNVGLYWFT